MGVEPYKSEGESTSSPTKSVAMAMILIFIALISSLLACPPTPAPYTNPPTTTAASTTSSSATASDATTAPSSSSTVSPTGGAKKREVTKVEVTVITNQKYDPLLNDSHLQVFRMLLNDYIKANGIIYNKDLVQEEVKNEGGNFSVHYTVLGGDCNKIKYLVANGEHHAEFIKDVIIKC